MIDIDDVNELYRKARELIRSVKDTQHLLYQLCFIATSRNPKSSDALLLLDKMVKLGLISEEEKVKALQDVARWRDRILDRVIRGDEGI